MYGWGNITTLFEAETSGGYDWSVIQLISRPHGDTVQYAVYVDGGCSCNGPRDMSPDWYGLVWTFDFAEARREAEIRAASSYNFTDAEKAEMYADLRKVRP